MAPMTPTTTSAATVSPAPAALPAAGVNVYAGSNDGYLCSFNGTDGSLRWNLKSGGAVAGRPTLAGGIAYVGSNDSFIYAMRADTGTQAWKQQVDGPFSRTYRVFPQDSACLVPATMGTVAPGPRGSGQRAPLHRRCASLANCLRAWLN
jgi:outer membrane protein assembly factor BamB